MKINYLETKSDNPCDATTQQIANVTFSMIPPSLQKHPYIVISNRSIASGVFELRLKPEADENRIPMPEAGQWVYLELPDDAGQASGLRRAYSIASAPYEIEDAHSEIMFAIKLAGEVTKKLESCNEGDRLWLQGPFGRFTLLHAEHPAVFIAGGIGITPLRSMLIEALHKNPNRSLTLVLSSKTKDELPYHEAMRSLANDRANFSYLPTCTREEEGSDWDGLRGRISKELFEQLKMQSPEADFYLCGPTALMDGLSEILKSIGVDSKKIHTEKFG
jgi:phenol/toluene 2-monooxygenase (NADH) P5/A5